MRRIGVIGLLTTMLMAGSALPAAADITAFWGRTTSPAARGARGFAVGVSMLVVGFEGEYANTEADPVKGAPALRTGSINALLQSPTRTQLYVTAGAGFFREVLGPDSVTNVGTNVGGGIKIGLAGPLRLRVDYRVFHLRGSARYKTPQRVYVGANLAF